MVTTAVHYDPQDPFFLLQSCDKALSWIIESHARQGQPIRRSWIDVPTGGEKITLLEEEVLPLVAQVLMRVKAIDRELQEHQQELEARIKAEL